MTDLTTETGQLDLNRIASLSKYELREWIETRLHGRDIHGLGDVRQGDLPHYLIASIYPELDRDTRSYLRQIIEGFLYDMARNEESSWRGDAAHALLMLAQRVGEPVFIEPILEMSEEQVLYYPERVAQSGDVHSRLLQSLVVLGWIGSTEFWHEQFNLAPEHYAGVVFAGLAQIALPHAINLLPVISWETEEVQEQMRVALRGLLPKHQHDVIGQALTNITDKLADLDRALIGEFLPEVEQFASCLIDNTAFENVVLQSMYPS